MESGRGKDMKLNGRLLCISERKGKYKEKEKLIRGKYDHRTLHIDLGI